jgi:hypothetical protein
MLTREVLAAAQLRCALGTHDATKVGVMCPAEAVPEQWVAITASLRIALITKPAPRLRICLIARCNHL